MPGASNERVRSALGWTRHYASWRTGFEQALAAA